MELKIYDKQGMVKMTVSPDNSSQWNHEVGVENVVTVNFTTWEFLVLKVGWYILVEGQRFSIKSEYRPKHIHDTKYTYNLKFYGREHDAQDILFCRLNQGEDDLESVFAYDGTPMDFLQKVVANMNRNTDGVVWKAGEAISANKQTINFNGLYCWDALGEIARAFGTEWWMDGEYLNISKCERGESVSLGYGQGLKSGLTQNENTNAVKWFTRLIPVGSSKNIDKSKYGYATLQLPGREKYIDINTQYGLKEYREEAAFSEIYPHRVGAISSVRSEDRTNEETGNYTVYYVKDSSLPFNPDEYMIGGEVIHMTFNSGALAGKDFEVNWNNETKEFEIINQYPDENTQLPGGNLVPSADDTYVLWNISMPDEYIRAAEQELKTAVDVYLAEYSKDISVYSGSTDYIYISKNDVPLLLGQRVRLLSEVYFGNIGRDSRITRVSRKLNNLNEATIDCSDAIASSWKSSVDSSLNQLQFAVSNEMAQALIQILKTGEPGTPSDYNVLSALRSLNTFLRKDKDDTAKGNITFEKNIGSHDFVKGDLMGAGWSIYKDANGNTVVETDTIIARKGINASELIINQETFQKGSTIYVKGGCTITKVEEIDGVYRCYYDNEGGKRFSGFQVGDQARCQRYDSSYGLTIKYYWRLVVGVADDYVDLSITDFDGDGVPEAGDDIAQLGNRTDKTRQSAIVISPDNGGSVVVWAGIGDGEYPYSLSEKNMCGMGVNAETGRAYIYGYGDMFFGDRNESSFVKFDIENGVEIKGRLSVGTKLSDGRDLEDTLKNLSPEGYDELVINVENLSEKVDEFGTDLEAVKKQTDREFTIWFFNHEPNLYNEPAVNWNTDELKAEHDQDLFYYRDAGKAWRFEGGNWKSITDQDTIRALELIAATRKEVADMSYLTKALKDASPTVIENGLVITSVVAVQNHDGDVEAFINGSEFAEDEEHGKLLIAGGIPHKSSDGLNDLKSRSKESTTRIYEDGSAFLGNANIIGSFNSGDGKTIFEKDGRGQLANGNIRWDSDGTMWKKSPEYIVWRRIEEEYEAGDTIDLQGGSYLDITAGIDLPEYTLPSPETDKTIAIRYIHASRSDAPAMLVGNFNINGVETTRITIAGSGRSFELEYNTTTGKWHYYGYSGLGYYDKYGEVIVLLDKEEESTTPSINGLTKTITIHGVYGEYELTFESGLLTGYKYNPTEGGN